MNILEKFGSHKHANPIHHYHMHYYPLPLLLPRPLPLPPPLPPLHKIEIDLSSLHSGLSHSLDWHGRGNYQEPEIVLPGTPTTSWPSQDQHWDNSEISEKTQQYKEANKSPRIELQAPFHQHVLIYHPPAKEAKSKLLKAFFSKLRRLNDALFHPEDDDSPDHDNASHVDNSLGYGA
ncbi:PREDICTED: uncharacterized protein LOC105362985 isoform X2 [Ceratosolen solmsi marchali]|nr:PREDICTED: uncharacterized protein LOC105362985 isoform X2 [Ceratosolen solmsi marchali]